MRYGLSIPNFAEAGQLLEVAEAAEAGGWDGFFLWDHLVLDRLAPPPVSEPWTVLAAVSVRTTSIRLGTLVTPLPRRRPWVLARQVVTVDHLSGGRAVLGVGLGVPADAEYATFGESADPRRHGELLDEGLQVVDALWSGRPTSHDGRHHHLEEVRFLPTPVQRPRVPVWVAAALPARAGVRRAARWDGIAPIVGSGADVRGATPSEVRGIVEEVRSLRGGVEGFDVAVLSTDLSPRACDRLGDAGATWVIAGPDPAAWLEDALAMAAEGPPQRR